MRTRAIEPEGLAPAKGNRISERRKGRGGACPPPVGYSSAGLIGPPPPGRRKLEVNSPRNIFLIGPMGAGKTTVGRQLAKSLDKVFLDCDRELEEHTGASISLIFELEGEEGFRRRERDMLNELSARGGIVLATGGGAVLDSDNRARLRSRGFAIYLDAPLDLLVERTSRDRSRPLLDTPDPRTTLERILGERDPLYRQVADLVVQTHHGTARHIVKEILHHLDHF